MQKRSSGKPIGGNLPLGYKRKKLGWDNERNRPLYSKEWHIDKKEAEIVRRIFKMYASGNYSIQKIAEILTKEGYKTRMGNPFTFSSVKCIIPNKSYLGLVWSPRKPLPDIKSTVHKPIISKKLFDKCQDVLAERKGKFGRPVAKHRFYLLQGLVYCYNCIKHLKGNEKSSLRRMHPSMYCEYHRNNKTGKENYFYTCKFAKENKSCKQPKVECEIIDKQIFQFMSGMKLPEDVIKLTLESLRELFKKNAKNQKTDEEIHNILSRKKRLKVMFENGHIPENEYLYKMQKAKEEIESFERKGVTGSMTAREQEQRIKKTEKFLKEFGKFWREELSKEEKRDWIRMTIKRIWVKNKKVVAVEPRDDFKDLFSAHRKVIVQAPLVAHFKTSFLSCFLDILKRVGNV
ncbi:MAG: recombinase family protein [Patescibacteria group bacterium]